MFATLWNDEKGAVLSAELVLILTILVIGMIVGLSEVAVAVNAELNDVSNAIGSLNQTYTVSGFRGFGVNAGKLKSNVLGSAWVDGPDDCDANTSCDLICGIANITPGEGGL